MTAENPSPEVFTKVIGEMVGSTNAQVMALFYATWVALAKAGVWDDATVRIILDEAEKMVLETRGQNIIADLRRRLFPVH